MLALFFAVLLGFFPQPVSREAAVSVMRQEVLQNGYVSRPLAPYDKAPVSVAAASAARAAVRESKQSQGAGVTVHEFAFPGGESIQFSDHPKKARAKAKRTRVVQFGGSSSAAMESPATFDAAGRAAGLSQQATDALRFISQHEGGFDAINTWDSARFSWGFIQFAGGRGLPPAMALIKGESPKLFQSLFANYGVDVVPDAAGKPCSVFVSPKGVLYGKAAEQAWGDSPLVVALFIRAGRNPEIKQRQVEAAIHNYAAPALAATYGNIRVSDVLRSPQSLAMLIDRKVHEGNVARLGRAVEAACALAPPRTEADRSRVEALVLDQTVQNARDRDIRGRLLNIRYSALPGPAVYYR